MKKVFCILLIILIAHCKERYEIPTNSPNTGYLVVEGHINSSGGPTSFMLSRTVKLSGNRSPKTETNARVQIEDQNNLVLPLTEKGNGLYSADVLNLNPLLKYRLRIRTSAGVEYLSDLVELKKTPTIDSINWKMEGDGVHIYSNAHDDLNNTRYYKWDYVETWEYHAARVSSYKYENGKVSFRTPEEQVYRCWTSRASTNIFIGSTVKLTKDVVYLNPLITIPTGSVKIGVLYSFFVRQYALSKEGYAFLENMKKNTEAIGSVFDPQPSELHGNIHAVNNPDEPVIGFVTAGTVAEKRIFINRTQLPYWPYGFDCLYPDTLVYNHADSIKKYFVTGGYAPIIEHYSPGGALIGWDSNEINCVDCTTQGGRNVKPTFWP